MGRWMHIIPAAFLAASVPAGPAGADMLDDPLRLFANCVGRLTAELSHQWLLRDPAASETEALRSAMIDVLAALAPPGDSARVLNMRIEARVAHDALRMRGTFRADAWAEARADAEIATCAAHVVGSNAEVAAAPSGTASPSALPARLLEE
ncbi:hypothetical protein HKCCE4037_11070 [Rhodobacterales bacterium HKCCE4037]|nr:hypothetical protein [Rhodobacterales bacterium HKCCE4037]